MNAYEKADRVPSPTQHKYPRQLSGKIGNWSPVVAHNKERKVAGKGGFAGLGLGGGMSESFKEVVQKAKKGVHIKSAEEKRRENLRSQILVLGITDQTPGMSRIAM
jgi:hypothetical protein